MKTIHLIVNKQHIKTKIALVESIFWFRFLILSIDHNGKKEMMEWNYKLLSSSTIKNNN